MTFRSPRCIGCAHPRFTHYQHWGACTVAGCCCAEPNYLEWEVRSVQTIIADRLSRFRSRKWDTRDFWLRVRDWADSRYKAGLKVSPTIEKMLDARGL